MAKILTPKKVKALESLLMTGSVTAAAQAAGVTRAAVYGWFKNDPAFVAELRKQEGIALQLLGQRLLAMTDLAAKAVFDCLQPGEPLNIRLRAAALVAERGPILAEMNVILDRIAALERRKEI